MNNTPTVTVNQMREVDRLMVDEIGVSILMMMENASRNIAILSRKLLGGNVKKKHIVVLCGKGNNGGDGLSAARHLINFGGTVTCILSEHKENLRSNARVQFNVLENIDAAIIEFSDEQKGLIQEKIKNSDLIIDALLGYNLKGNPEEPIATLIRLANKSRKPILAVDIPSGLSGDAGEASEPTIKATATLTLALPKVGLQKDMAKEYVGELYLADLSVPAVVYRKLGIDVPILFEFVGQTIQVIGEVMIGITAIMVHRRVWKEHKINPLVYKEMQREQIIGILGIVLLVAGYFIQILWN
ncbi:MAG: NAD(P)H-hydrate epimerase [Candidatus Levybacteria bacterium]|nr:NAD(P)H-hydrate epimerase [Candidatus Levybacteria bacterium]